MRIVSRASAAPWGTRRKRPWHLLAVGLLVSSVASGQDDTELTAARDIAAQGLEAYDVGNYEEAADKLWRAFQVVKLPTVALHTARALEKAGRLVEASEVYLQATRLPATGEFQAEQEQAQQDAERERAALMPRLPRIVVSIEGADPEEVEVTVDGKEVSVALLGGGYVVNPGARRIEGKRGEQVVTAEVEIGEGEKQPVTLRFGAEVADASGATGDAAVTEATSDATADRASDGSLQRTLGWAGIGVGGAGLLVGTITGIMAGAKKSDLDEGGCDGNECYADQRDDIDSYNSLRTLSTVGFVAGLVGGAAGVTLLLTAPKPEPAEPEVHAWLGVGAAGVAGRF